VCVFVFKLGMHIFAKFRQSGPHYRHTHTHTHTHTLDLEKNRPQNRKDLEQKQYSVVKVLLYELWFLKSRLNNK